MNRPIKLPDEAVITRLRRALDGDPTDDVETNR